MGLAIVERVILAFLISYFGKSFRFVLVSVRVSKSIIPNSSDIQFKLFVVHAKSHLIF
jgi:hypothetical protein